MREKKTYIILLVLFSCCAFSQNKRGVYPSAQNLPPSVHFSWEGTCLGDTTCFINQTLLGNTYTWTIVGGTPHPHTMYISNDTNLCYYFSTPGTYTVSLHAYNNHDVTLTNILKIDTVTKADFSFELCSNRFINNSLCSSSFLWDFGDGTTSSAFTPTHQYADTGHYSVKLIAYNGIKSDTLSQIIYVSVADYTNPLFTYTISYDTVFVHAAFTGTQTNYYWSFNDPNNPATNFAGGKDTLHVYKDSIASYGINLTVINPCGPTFKIYSVYIDLLPAHLTFVSNLSIVPNPASGSTINIYYNSFNSADYLATVYNALGEIVFELYFSFQVGINGFKILNDVFAPGPYILVLQSENIYARRKFIVLKP